MIKTTYRLPQSVIEDTHSYRAEVEKFLRGETSLVAFRAIRVPMGIYEQRESDTYMVRVRGAAGVFLPHQVKRIAELSAEFGSGIVHVTTRQDLQIHRVDIKNTPMILERLLEAGLSTRGGGGNTVRNISACPFAGVCPDEAFDVTPYAFAMTEYLLRERCNFNLPRKFKVAFSGCGKDCALGSAADVGFFAHEKDGIKGFSVYAGGGMGAYSALSVLIENFIPTESIFEVAEAVKRLFDKHGDRMNRHKARLRFVLERVGVDEFRRLYKEEVGNVRQQRIAVPEIQERLTQPVEIDTHPIDEPDDTGYRLWESKRVRPQKQRGLYMALISLRLGDIQAAALSKISDLAELGDGVIRTTQDQNLLLRSVPGQAMRQLYSNVKDIDEYLVTSNGLNAVACAGASTCKLGLCLSRGLAEALDQSISGLDIPFDDPLRISGCPNSCGQHPIAPIGLYGVAKRVNGRLVPFYTIVTGGNPSEGDATLARYVARVPARALPALFREFWNAAAREHIEGETLIGLLNRWGTNYLGKLANQYDYVPSYEEAPEFYRDFGSSEDFSLAGRGPGECGAGVMDVIALDIDTAKSALQEARPYDAIVASARALLITRGLEPKKDREVFEAFTKHFIEEGWIVHRAGALLDAAVDFKLGDRDSLNDLRGEIDELLSRVETLFGSLDSNLNFRVERAPVMESTTEVVNAGEQAQELDLRGVACPMNFVRAKIELEQIETGGMLDILLDGGEPVRNVPASFTEQGEEVVSVTSEETHYRVKVCKRT